MSFFIITEKFNLHEATENIKLLQQWFKQNPKRRVCHTDRFKVRKNHIVEDVLDHTKKEEHEKILKQFNNEARSNTGVK